VFTHPNGTHRAACRPEPVTIDGKAVDPSRVPSMLDSLEVKVLFPV